MTENEEHKSSTLRLLSFDVGIRNLSFAVLTYTYTQDLTTPWKSLTVEHWDSIDILTEGGCKVHHAKTVTPLRCGDFMIRALHARPYLFAEPLDLILVEDQPLRGGAGGVGSAKNKVLSHILVTYCRCWYLAHPTETLPKFLMMSAKKKLRVNMAPERFCFLSTETTHTPSLAEKEEEKNYYHRKKKAKTMCQELLKRITISETLLAHYHDKNKQDDMADSFLQGIFYLQEQQPKPSKKRKRQQIAPRVL